ncbi:MAG: 5-oxoprolinase [Acidimicrobiales bacterium]|nr:5-oxoprolinase [Acidimicrobiales bacterium]
MRVGVDTGGTFTDVVTEDGRIAKVPSTPGDPGDAVRSGLAELADLADPAEHADPERPEVLVHGTTVATNALLERRGGRVALVTNEGFADVIEIARQDRPSLYDLWADRPEPLVPRDLRLEVAGRLDAAGRELEPVAADDVPLVAAGVDAVAVCLLHADLASGHEQVVAAELARRGHDVSCSSDVSPQLREYERTVTTVVNAYLRPACRAYLAGLVGVADDVLVMTSAGGLVPVDEGAARPVSLLLSGPAGGVRAAAAVAAACGYADAITFDMGGTSTDVCLVLDGVPAPAGERSIGGLPIRQPSLDVHTIGAGGGSVARVDPGGALAVGPRSAGAVPGPACCGLGGTEPTVTDANLVAGRIPADAELPGIGRLDLPAAQVALADAGLDAEGVLRVVDAAMEQALRAVSVERGVDPSGLVLVAFGGAGPLHACALADALGLAAVIVPPRAGVLSAVGLLASPRQVDRVRTWPGLADHAGLDEALAALAADAAEALPGAELETAVECRYAGQSHELRVAAVADFAAEHLRRNGYDRPGTPVEVVALRATARLAAPLDVADLPLVDRQPAVGPTVIAEPDCTVWLPAGWSATPDPTTSAFILRRTPHDQRQDRAGSGGHGLSSRAEAAAVGSAVGSASARPEGDVEVQAQPGTASVGSRPGPGAPPPPAELAVLIARLTGVADEMGAVLRRAAFSPNVKERADCSAALFTADGTLLVQAEHIPVHLGSMPASVAAAIDAFGGNLAPGEQVILNVPFAGGTHLNDVTLVAPVHHPRDGRLVGWVANRAHHADLGGAAPGSIPADAVEIQQEGLRIPPVRLTPEVRALLLASSRTPDERAGDLDAQLGANRLGAERFAVLADEPLDAVVAYGERRMRAALGALDDGVWEFADVLDSFGPAADQQQPTRIQLTVRVAGDEVEFDFTGTDPQRRGNVNAVEAVTVSAVAWALRSVLDPTIPANGGALRPVHVRAPAGSVVAAQPPAAVGAGNVEVSQRVADVCLGALAQALPARVPAASQGTMNNLLIGGTGWVYYETVAGGQGGRPPHPSGGGPRPGMSGVHTAMTNTKNTPVEALERAFPLRVRRYRLREDSGGPGAAPGGEGIARDLEVLEDVTASLITERRSSQPWGLAGGGPGATGENWLLPAGDEARGERLADKCTIRLAAGDVLRMLTPGGGGWGQLDRTRGGPIDHPGEPHGV